MYWTQADIHSVFAPVLAQSEQFEARPHRPRATVIGEANAMADVRQAVPFRDQELDALAVKFACGISKRFAGLIGGEQDGPRLINDERGVRRLSDRALQDRSGMHCVETPGDRRKS